MDPLVAILLILEVPVKKPELRAPSYRFGRSPRRRTACRQEITLFQGESAGMLPRDEWLALIHTLATAIDRAGEGKLAEGYAALQAGLTRALEQQGRGKPGSAEAVAAGSLTLRGAVPVGSGGRIAVRGAAGLALLQPAPARARRRCRRRARSPGWRLNT